MDRAHHTQPMRREGPWERERGATYKLLSGTWKSRNILRARNLPSPSKRIPLSIKINKSKREKNTQPQTKKKRDKELE